LHDQISEVFVESVNVCQRVYLSKIESEFSRIYMFMASKLLASSESILELSQKAVFISITNLLRTMRSDIAMLKYLYDYANLRSEWLNENESSYRSSDFRSKFEDKVVSDYVSKTWPDMEHSGFTLLSKAVHASSFGSKRFDNETSLFSSRLEENLENYGLAVHTATNFLLKAMSVFIQYFTNLRTKIEGFEEMAIHHVNLVKQHNGLFRKQFGHLL